MNCYIVQSYASAKRIMEVEHSSYIIVVDTIHQSKKVDFLSRLKNAKEHCDNIYLIYTSSLLNEEVVREIMKNHGIKRLMIPTHILRNPKNKNLKDLSSLTEQEILEILSNKN